MQPEIIAIDLSTPTPYCAWAKFQIQNNNTQTIAHITQHFSNSKFLATKKQYSAYNINHNKILTSVLEDLRKQINGLYSNVSCIVLNIGPGSFSGLRIAMSFAKGVNAALGCKIIGVDSMQLWANIYKNYRPLISVIDARSNKFYVQYFNAGDSDHVVNNKIQDLTINDICNVLQSAYITLPIYIAGYGMLDFYNKIEAINSSTATSLASILYKSMHIINNTEVDIAQHLLVMGLEKFQKGQFLADNAAPIYVREAL